MGMTNDPMVFIILLNWNNWEDTIECVESCEKLTYKHFRILIVDNGSTDGSEQFLHQQLPSVEILQTGSNLGFAGGNNVGIRHALGQGATFIWLLNNDTVVHPYSLDELVKVCEHDPAVGITGSKIYLYSQQDVIWFAGGLIDWKCGQTSHIGGGEQESGQFKEVKEVDYITGCSLLIRAEVIHGIGLMDESYFLYYEEVDWNIRAKQAGWKIMLAPQSLIWHKVAASSGGDSFNRSPVADYYDTRNNLIFIRRFCQPEEKTTAFLHFSYRIFRKIIRIFLKKENHQFLKIKAIIKGIWDYLRGNYGRTW